MCLGFVWLCIRSPSSLCPLSLSANRLNISEQHNHLPSTHHVPTIRNLQWQPVSAGSLCRTGFVYKPHLLLSYLLGFPCLTSCLPACLHASVLFQKYLSSLSSRLPATLSCLASLPGLPSAHIPGIFSAQPSLLDTLPLACQPSPNPLSQFQIKACIFPYLLVSCIQVGWAKVCQRFAHTKVGTYCFCKPLSVGYISYSHKTFILHTYALTVISGGGGDGGGVRVCVHRGIVANKSTWTKQATPSNHGKNFLAAPSWMNATRGLLLWDFWTDMAARLKSNKKHNPANYVYFRREMSHEVAGSVFISTWQCLVFIVFCRY